MIQLRPYQQEAVEAVYDYLRAHDDNPCVVIPTAGGKTPVMSTICRDAVLQWKGRVLILAHVKELLEQAADKLRTICPEVKFGVYSAGLRRRDTEHAVIVAGIQSVYKRACELDAFDLIIVDECFVEGTLISTPSGAIPIGYVQPGMFARNALGMGQVVAISARLTYGLVTLEYSDGTAITCTANHPIFTESGWKQAGSLEIGSLAFGVEDLRMLRETVSPLVQAASGWQPQDSEREAVAKATFLLDLLLKDPQQLHALSREPSEGQPHNESSRKLAAYSWRQWANDQTAAETDFSTGCGVGGRVLGFRSELQNPVTTEEPQDRRGQSVPSDRNRTGWPQSPITDTPTAGLSQEYLPGSKRLVRVSHHESTRGRVVFNLQVTGHPSYFANGILAHNCHLIPPDGEGMYRQFLADAKVVNPRVRTIGLTATPFRLKSGMICGPPDDHILNAVCYEIGVKELIRDGYLCPLVTKAGVQKADTSSLHVRAGEFMTEEVEDLMDSDELVEAACREIVEYTKDRHAVLIFASGVKHAQHIQHVLQDRHDQECGLVSGKTPTTERDGILARFRGGEHDGLFQQRPLKYLVNVNVLTTGFDAPNIDCVAIVRPTMSPGLWYQMVGRGFRLHPGKGNCLVLDFGGNAIRHGPVDQIRVCDAANGNGKSSKAPAKECPKCHALIAAGYSSCPDCGYEFPAHERTNHDAEASTEGVLSGQVTNERILVRDVFYTVHTKRGADEDAPKTMRVDYKVGWHEYKSEWVCFEHEGYARWKAEQWWLARSQDPIPDSAERAVDVANAGGLAATKSIVVRRVAGDPYERVVDYELGPKPEPVVCDPADVFDPDEISF